MTADFHAERIDLAQEADFRLGGLLVRPSTRQVEAGGKSETLQPRIMQVLVVLAGKCGQVVSRDELSERCWEGRAVGEDSLNRCTQAIRKLGETSGAFRLETIPRVGYRLHTDGTYEALPAAPLSGDAVSRRWKDVLRRPPAILGLAGLLIVAAVAVGALPFMNSGGNATDIVGQQRIAFFGVAAAEGEDLSTIATAATDEIYKSLDSASLEIAAPAAVEDVAANRLVKARELGAVYALSGQARLVGDQVVGYLRLEDTYSSTTLWEESFTVPRVSAPNLPAQMGALASRRLGCITRLRVGLKTGDVETARLLPRACSSTEGENINLWRMMGKRAPSSVPILAGMSSSLSFAASQAPDASRATMLAEAEAAALRALELDPKHGAAYVAKFLVARMKGAPFAEQQAILEAGLRVAPDDTWLNLWYGNLLSWLGRTRDALAPASLAASTDPVFFWKPVNYARSLAIAGRGPEAARLFEDSVRRTPSADGWRFWMYAAVFGNAGASGPVLAQAPISQLLPGEVECWRKVEIAVGAQTPASRRSGVESVSECLAKGSLSEEHGFLVLAGLGDFDRILASPDRIPRGGEIFYPHLSDLRAHTLFTSYLQKSGALEYWKGTGTRPDFCETEDAPVCATLAPPSTR